PLLDLAVAHSHPPRISCPLFLSASSTHRHFQSQPPLYPAHTCTSLVRKGSTICNTRQHLEPNKGKTFLITKLPNSQSRSSTLPDLYGNARPMVGRRCRPCMTSGTHVPRSHLRGENPGTCVHRPLYLCEGGPRVQPPYKR
ncbi:unnamed protein product, partial [Ectocarpus sp. 12 AP-2014]